ADQLPVYMALAQGTSRFQARHLSRHAETALWLLRQFIPLRVEVEPQPAGVAVSLAPPSNL
ncbi:MAG: RNA 3'-terminal phosphate cyclase, partial [Burkholderiales bacterium]